MSARCWAVGAFSTAIAFDVPMGGRVAIVGPNGAGKSTLARLAGGLLRPTSGSISVLGGRWTSRSEASKLRRRVGVGLSRGGLFSDLTAWENVRAACGPLQAGEAQKAHRQVERVLADVGAENYADRTMQSQSVGERRRVEMARLLINDPELLILDDVLLGIDQWAAADLSARLLSMLERRRRSLLWLGSDMAVAGKFAEVILRLENGLLSLA